MRILSCLLITLLVLISAPFRMQDHKSSSTIYHYGWIDLNKNGRMDVYENPTAPIERRVEDLLSQMNLEEKTCQTATLYGYKRVLQDELPTPNWKTEI
jgi:beta-glucosidase